MSDFTWKAGDTEPALTDTLSYSDGTLVNLTGATVRFVLRQVGASGPLTTTGRTTVLNPPGGAVAFQPSAVDTATPGLYQASWVVTFSSGDQMTFPTVGNLWGTIEASVTSTTSAPPIDELIRPSVDELAEFIPSRTVESGTGGSEKGTFTQNTRPTLEQAASLIDQAVQAVLMQTGTLIPSRLVPQTRWLVVIHAAMLLELRFYSNEIARDQSAYGQYQALFISQIQALRGSIGDEDPAAPVAPFWSVPVLNAQQQHWQQIFAAMDPKTGLVDPSKLGPEEFFPMGIGGIPANILQAFPWLYGQGGGDGFMGGLAFLED